MMPLQGCLYGTGRNNFDAGNIHCKGHCMGWALKKIETFWCLEMATREANAIWAQKSREGGVKMQKQKNV
jgi:hypothetical protein